MAFHNAAVNKKKVKFKLRLNPLTSLTIPFVLVLLILVILPFFFVVVYSLGNFENNAFYLTLNNFVMFIKDKSFWNKLGLSVYFAAFSTLTCLLFGYPVAYFIARTKPKTRNILVMLITLPMWVNLLLRIIGLKSIMQSLTSWINTWQIPGAEDFSLLGTDFAIIFGETYTSLPFMIIPIYTQLLKLDPTLLEASKDLGSNPVKTFFKVTLPISMPGVISGITMVFLPAATSIVIPKYMGGGKTRYALIGSLIENYFIKQNNYSQGCAMAIITALIILLIIFFLKFFDRSEVKVKSDRQFKRSIAKREGGVK